MKLYQINHPPGRCDGLTCGPRTVPTWINLDEINSIDWDDNFLTVTLTNGVFYQLHGERAINTAKALKVKKGG